MPSQKKLSSINLVPQDEFDRSVIGKALKWSLTTGKSIVILTEFVVILAFLSRFKLDRDLNDLNEVILQKQGIVESYSAVEAQMRDVQARLDLVGQLKNTSVKVSQSMQELSLLIPLDTKLETVDLGQSNWIIKGTSGSELGFATLISRLENSGKFAAVEVSDIRYDLRKGGLVFNIEATFPKAPARTARGTTPRPTPTPAEET